MSVVRSVLFALILMWIPFSPFAFEAGADQLHPDHIGASHSALVDAVRRATELFRDARNVPPGYGAVLGCVSGPDQGAMGVHFVNPALLTDDVLDKSQPEALSMNSRTAPPASSAWSSSCSRTCGTRAMP
jgi:hypothetical protein